MAFAQGARNLRAKLICHHCSYTSVSLVICSGPNARRKIAVARNRAWGCQMCSSASLAQIAGVQFRSACRRCQDVAEPVASRARPANGPGRKSPSPVVSLMHRSTRPSLSWVGVPRSALLRVAHDAGEVEHVAGTRPRGSARLSPFSCRQLGTRMASVERGVKPTEPQQRSMVVAQIVVAVLPEGERLHAGLWLPAPGRDQASRPRCRRHGRSNGHCTRARPFWPCR